MKALLIHTFYEQNGGEDQVFRNETALLSAIADVRQLHFFNNGGKAAMLLKFLLAPCNLIALHKFKKTLAAWKPDIIHIHNLHFACTPLIIRAAKKQGIPVVVTLHNFRLLCPSATLFHNGKLFTDSLQGGFPWKAVFQRVYRGSSLLTFWLAFTIQVHKWLGTWQKVDRYITLSPFARDLFLRSDLRLHSVQVEVKANFTPDKGFCTGNRDDYFLFAGRLSPEKGIRTLLQSVQHTPFKLVICGDGPLRSEVEQAVSQNSNIEYKGKCTANEVTALMKKASALLFPSVWFEGMPMTILESLCTGTPVIASRLGTMEHLITPGVNGLLFGPGNARALQDSMYRWQNLSDDARSAMCSAARQSFNKYYSPEINLGQLTALYTTLCHSKLQPTHMETQQTTRPVPVLGFPVFSSDLGHIELGRKTVINTINQYSYVMAMKDRRFKEALLASDILLPDGIGIVMASRLLNRRKIQKIAGFSLHQFILNKLNETGGSCFYLGSSDSTLKQIQDNIHQEYQSVRCGCYSPPYKNEFDDHDNRCMLDAINKFKPDVLFIGMTAPKQEKWAYQHRDELNANTICAIGAVFDFYAGTVHRPSNFWIRIGLEWFIRLLREPARMWKRYLYYGPFFILVLIGEKARQLFPLHTLFVKQTRVIRVSYYKINFKGNKV